MEFDVLDMISKDLGKGEKRLPTIGYQLTSQDADLLETVLSVGYRHFLFEPVYVEVLAETLQEYAGDEDIFLTLRVPVHTGNQRGAQHVVTEALSILQLQSIDMVLLYDDKAELEEDKQEKGYIWNSRWLELESLYDGGLVRNIGLYCDSAEDVQRVAARARCKPAIVYIPDVESPHFTRKMSRHDVISRCKSLDLRVGISMVDNSGQSKRNPLCSQKEFCRTMVEAGYSFVVSSQDAQQIPKMSQVFDEFVPPKKKLQIMKNAGIQK